MTKKNFSVWFIFILTLSANASNYIPIAGNAFHIQITNISISGDKVLVYATYDGVVRALNLKTNKNIWEYKIGSFPYDLKTIDINGDGKSESLVVTADGGLFALSDRGKLLWQFHSTKSLFSVAAGYISDNKTRQIVCGGTDNNVYLFSYKGELLNTYRSVTGVINQLVVADFDNDQKDEILFTETRTVRTLLKYTKNRFEQLWCNKSGSPAEYMNWENPGGLINSFSQIAADIDLDGKLEIISGTSFHTAQSVFVLDNKGDCLFGTPSVSRLKVFEDGTNTEFYSAALVQASDIYPQEPGLEIVCIAGSTITIYSSKGRQLEQVTTKLGFTDAFIDGKILWLGSTPNGDNTVYRINLDENWKEQASKLERQGFIKSIEQNLVKLNMQVKKYTPGDKAIKTQYKITPSNGKAGVGNNYLNALVPYNNIKWFYQTKLIEDKAPLKKNGEMWNERRWKVDNIPVKIKTTAEDIIAIARKNEKDGVPFLYNIGHSCTPFITLETAEEILQVAPATCSGFYTSEDEDPELFDEYFSEYYKPLANLCLKYGGKTITTKDKGPWWVFSTTYPKVYDALFNEKRNQVTTPSTEDSNSRTPELNLMGRSSLYMAGLINGFIINTNQDLFSWNRFFQWEYPKSGHPYLRLLVAHTLLGGSTAFMRHFDVYSDGTQLKYTTVGKESSEIFYHMIGKGLVFQPTPSAIRGFSELGIIVHEPQAKFIKDAYNGHSPQKWVDDEELENAVIPHNGCIWGMTTTPEHAIQRVLMNKKRQFGANVPATPYGLITFIPEQTDPHLLPYVSEWWHTDGIYLWKDGGPKLSGKEAEMQLKTSAEQCAKKLLFRTYGDDVFMQVVETEKQKYRIFMIDPGWIDPQERNVLLAYQGKGRINIKDVLTNEKIQSENNSTKLRIPAGSLRILEVSLE